MLTKTKVSVHIRKKVFGWSKYGGATKGMLKSEDTKWHCQCCGAVQSLHMGNYLIELNEREFMRICASCKYEAEQRNIDNYYDLRAVVS